MNKLNKINSFSNVASSLCIAGNFFLIVVFFTASFPFFTFILSLIAWNIAYWFISLLGRAIIYAHEFSPDWDEIVESGIICVDIAELPKEIYEKLESALVIEHIYDDTTVIARDSQTNEKKRYAQVEKIIPPKEKEQKALNGLREEQKPLLNNKGKK